MIEAETGTIVVLDVESGEVIAREHSAVEAVTAGEAPGASEDGRYTFFAHYYSDDHVTIVDSGTWTEPHGTHVHHYTTDASIVGVLDGAAPSHVVNHSGVVAVFYDGTGEVVVLDEDALDNGDIEVVETFTAGGPHHGVAVPVEDCYLTSLPTDNPTELPASIGLFCDGDMTTEVAECPELHGEAMLGTSIVFACADGVVRLDRDGEGWTSTEIAYPDIDDEDMFGASHPRMWGFDDAAGSDYLFSWAGTSHLYVYDHTDGDGHIRAVELPAPFTVYGMAAVPDTSTGLVLTTDGMLHRLDLAAGTVIESHPVVDPFEPDLTFATPHHYVVATTDRAFILDPPAQQVIEVHLDDTLTPGRSFGLAAPVAQLVLAPG